MPGRDRGHQRGLSGPALSRPALRVLGAATPSGNARAPAVPGRAGRLCRRQPVLRGEAKAGHLDADAVEAVLAAACYCAGRRRDGPGNLTGREVEVLRLVAQGLSSKQIAQRLVISPKTARNHIEHIYAKIGTSNRALGQPVRDAARAAAAGGIRPLSPPASKMGQLPHAGARGPLLASARPSYVPASRTSQER